MLFSIKELVTNIRIREGLGDTYIKEEHALN